MNGWLAGFLVLGVAGLWIAARNLPDPFRPGGPLDDDR